jgi:hypothetical protein
MTKRFLTVLCCLSVAYVWAADRPSLKKTPNQVQCVCQKWVNPILISYNNSMISKPMINTTIGLSVGRVYRLKGRFVCSDHDEVCFPLYNISIIDTATNNLIKNANTPYITIDFYFVINKKSTFLIKIVPICPTNQKCESFQFMVSS